jgi:hypothetical protein
LQRKVREVGGDGKLQEEPWPEGLVRLKGFGIACVNENHAQDQTANPDDGAPEIEWAGLQQVVLPASLVMAVHRNRRIKN